MINQIKENINQIGDLRIINKPLSREMILKVIETEGETSRAETEFYFNFKELKNFKFMLGRFNKTFGEVQQAIYKDYGLMPSILMIIGLSSSYEEYFKLRYNVILKDLMFKQEVLK